MRLLSLGGAMVTTGVSGSHSGRRRPQRFMAEVKLVRLLLVHRTSIGCAANGYRQC